jgi:hypothetical protein
LLKGIDFEYGEEEEEEEEEEAKTTRRCYNLVTFFRGRE